jgi:2-isopropylmalate synthase
MTVQANKAIVGANAFAHESGIHQDGFLKEKSTYEIMTPESVGAKKSTLVLGKHSGRHAFRERLKELGYELKEDELNKAFERFKWLADQKKDIFDEDLVAIVAEEVFRIPETYELISLKVESGTGLTPKAEVVLSVNGKKSDMSAEGDGPVDAALKTIASIAGTKSTMLAYEVKAITGGTDAQGEVVVRLREDGNTVMGQGSDPDIIVASAKAYVNALNRLEFLKKKGEKGVEKMCE